MTSNDVLIYLGFPALRKTDDHPQARGHHGNHSHVRMSAYPNAYTEEPRLRASFSPHYQLILTIMWH